MDQGAYLALAAALTVLGAIWTWAAFRRRGLGSGVRALGWTLLAPAAYLTGILRAGGRIVDALADWAARLVFSPTVWIGFGVAAIAVLLIFVARFLPTKERTGRLRRGTPKETSAAPGAGSVEAPKAAKRPAVKGSAAKGSGVEDDDEDMADVNDILKKYGIS